MVKILTRVRMSIAFHATSARMALKMRIAICRIQALNHSISHRTGHRIMPYALLADLTILLHTTFILFVVFGEKVSTKKSAGYMFKTVLQFRMME